MTPEPFEIQFVPDGRSSWAAGPVGLDVAAARAGILLEHPCGGQGTCGRCLVRVRSGSAGITEVDRDHLDAEALDLGWRLGCQLVIDGAATVEVPPVSRSMAGKSFGDDLSPEALARPVAERTAISPAPVVLSAPALLDRLAPSRAGAPRPQATPEALAALALLWSAGEAFTVVFEGSELIAAVPGAARDGLALAVDIGTTSLAAALVDLADGKVRASGARLNPQVAFGADVIARIRYSMEGAAHLGGLTRAVRDGLAELTAGLLVEAGADGRDVVAGAVAGNTTMLHAWAGVPIESLGTAPYEGTWGGAVRWKARAIGLPIHENANVYVFPMIRSHVGGDAVAAAVACRLDESGPPRMLIDLGTNTELLVAANGRVVATSAAAGPAFEGVSIRSGMRAGPGAIDLVSLPGDGRVLTSVVGGIPAAGICGSGIVDAVAEMLRVGVLAPSGSMRRDEGLAAAAVPYAPRLRDLDGQLAFVLASSPGEAGRDVVCTARDVREIQLAKGAILTAATLACRHLDLDLSDLEQVLVAGAFGNVLRKSSVRRIGLLGGVDPERIQLVGNAAGIGARLATLDGDVRRRASNLAAQAEYLELATHVDYQGTFLQALAFPAAP